jgi:hypothetical protein
MPALITTAVARKAAGLAMFFIVGAMAVSVAAPAFAGPPSSAQILLGRGMGQARIGGQAPRDDTGTAFTGGALAAWGPVDLGCYEGICTWKLSAASHVSAIVGGPIQTLITTAPGWRTAGGIGRGSSAKAIRARSGHRVK